MDFFQRQEIARRNTKWLEIYFALAVICTILAIYAVALVVDFWEYRGNSDDNSGSLGLADLWNPELFIGVSLTTGLIILCGSLYKISQLAGGGSVVAEMMNGVPVDPGTTDPDERKLLNIVEEMSIASGTPMPKVYLLPGEETINAFAAGHTTGDMVVCVTRGSMLYLKRDELQGVIGHEFSHILNGDMRLNLRLMGIVFGIISLVVIGKILLQTRGEKNPLPLVGLGLIAVGSIGAFFGKLIKSAVSRQREFLADASSVQFTRNPMGLANALKKVGDGGSRINEPNVEETSHLFFANGLSESVFEWMSTHPPLEQRIKELDPAWDGQFLPATPAGDATPEASGAEGQPSTRKTGFAGPMGTLLGTTILASGAGAGPAIATSAVLPHVGTLTAKHLDYAADIISKIPEPLVAASRDPMAATALVYALLVSRDEALRNTQLQQIQADPAVFQQTSQLLPVVGTLESRARLPLLTLSINALRNLTADQYNAFAKNLDAIMDANKEADLFAYVLQKIILSRLAPHFLTLKKPVVQFYALKPLIPDCDVVLSALAYAGQTEPADIENAFNQGVAQLGLPPGTLQPDPSSYDLNKIDAALNRLNQAAPQIKKAVIDACATTVAADGVIQENEAELLRAIADTLDCPIPPFLSV